MQYRGFWHQGRKERKFCTESFKCNKGTFENGDSRERCRIAHRLGEIRQNAKRPIIVKFRYRDTKWDVMKSRKLLKGTGVTFSEDLNWEMQQLFREVRTSDLTEACWSWNGKIQAKNKAGKIITIRYGKEWRHLFEEPAASEPQSAEPIEEGTHWKWRLCTLGR